MGTGSYPVKNAEKGGSHKCISIKTYRASNKSLRYVYPLLLLLTILFDIYALIERFLIKNIIIPFSIEFTFKLFSSGDSSVVKIRFLLQLTPSDSGSHSQIYFDHLVIEWLKSMHLPCKHGFWTQVVSMALKWKTL